MAQTSRIKRKKHGPEHFIREALRAFMQIRGWLVEIMHGSAYQSGIPDLYTFHPRWGERWIDAKVAGKYSFTPAQRVKWPEWESFGCGIWILTGATQEEYDKLFRPPNWRDYWKASWGELPDIDQLLSEITE